MPSISRDALTIHQIARCALAMALSPRTDAYLLLFVLLFSTSSILAGGRPPTIAGDNFVYRVAEIDTNKTCLYASFALTYTIYYVNESSNVANYDFYTFTIPSMKDNRISVGGSCLNDSSVLTISWLNETNFTAMFYFSKYSDNWTLSQVGIKFNFTNNNFKDYNGSATPTFSTAQGNLFSRTFGRGQYFYCDRCKWFNFSREICDHEDCPAACLNATNTTVYSCSHVVMDKAVIFPGDFESDRPGKKLCIEDYIALQEMIVPIVVGGVLGLLLALIFVAYILAYIRRRRKEARSAQYEPVSDY